MESSVINHKPKIVVIGAEVGGLFAAKSFARRYRDNNCGTRLITGSEHAD